MANEVLNEQPSQTVQPQSGKTNSGSVFPWQRWDVIACTGILNLFALAIPLFVLQLCDRIIPDQSYRSLFFMGIGISVALILEGILHHSRNHILSWLGMHFEHGGAVGAFNHLVYTDRETLTNHQVANGFEAVEDITKLKEFLVGQGFLILLNLPFSLLFLGAIACFSFQIAIIDLTAILAFIFLAWRMGKKLAKYLDHQAGVNEQQDTFVLEILNNYHTLKAFGMEKLLMRSYELFHRNCAKSNYHVSLYAAKAHNLSNLLSSFLFIGCISTAALQVVNGTATLGIMAALLILTNQVIEQIQTAMRIWIGFQYFIIARKRVGLHFSLPLNLPQTHGIIKPIHGKLALENLYFQYTENNVYLLEGINLTIEPGSMVTIHGDNGIGKTTLMKLLMGDLCPTSGTILIDDVTLPDYDPRNLRDQIAYIPPRSTLFQGTILENMTLYRNTVYEDAIRFSRQLGLEAWVSRLPLGYNTTIEDPQFLSLPDGIQQRICLIRSLAIRPKILILDEANICLDQEGNRLLRQVLQALHHKTTIIFITHQLAIQELADASYELKDGRLTFQPLTSAPDNQSITSKILQMSQFVKSRKRVNTPNVEPSPALYKTAGFRS